MPCKEVEFILDDKDLYAREYPQCQADWNGSPVTHVAVLADVTENDDLRRTAAIRAVFGLSTWAGFWIHAVVCEYYLFLTKDESDRLKMVSEKRQKARQMLNERQSASQCLPPKEWSARVRVGPRSESSWQLVVDSATASTPALSLICHPNTTRIRSNMTGNDEAKRRSKHGCLTCRQKRKKCDERRPECSRCERTLSQCVWPRISYLSLSGTPHLLASGSTQQPVRPSSVTFDHLPHPEHLVNISTTASLDSSLYQPSVHNFEAARHVTPIVGSNPCSVANSVDFEDEDPDLEEIQSVVRRSIDALGGILDPDFLELCRFYSAFITRYFYDYSQVGSTIIPISRRRLSYLAPALRKNAKDRYQLALETLPADMESRNLSPATKLTSLAEILTCDYYLGNFPTYYKRLHQAASIVRQIVGSNALDLMNMQGVETIDVRIFAWCDILSSMATSKPTLFDYEFGINSVQKNNFAVQHNVGIEWIFGCPNTIAVTMARISSLRHSALQDSEKFKEGEKIEQTVIAWSAVSPVTNRSTQIITRLAVQEIWRHTALLYIHQAIYRSSPDHYTVRESVKQIIRITSTFRSGGNPDCFLAVPYFIAGSFATSVQYRHHLRARLLGCGNEQYLRDLANTLDELWRETDITGSHVTWSTKQPPTFIF
ncbi:Fungal specific transcription factor domain [Ceratobasidium sp. AG-Ba]|nr:Fungal specific transcription factor domain [Ceratobasidium sp. AG-Ba]QRW03593.1 Fungal specific transcription factor domain [Ceratobasidium sp. AG-Ba]